MYQLNSSTSNFLKTKLQIRKFYCVFFFFNFSIRNHLLLAWHIIRLHFSHMYIFSNLHIYICSDWLYLLLSVVAIVIVQLILCLLETIKIICQYCSKNSETVNDRNVEVKELGFHVRRTSFHREWRRARVRRRWRSRGGVVKARKRDRLSAEFPWSSIMQWKQFARVRLSERTKTRVARDFEMYRSLTLRQVFKTHFSNSYLNMSEYVLNSYLKNLYIKYYNKCPIVDISYIVIES